MKIKYPHFCTNEITYKNKGYVFHVIKIEYEDMVTI